MNKNTSETFGELTLHCIYDPSPTDKGYSWRGEMWRGDRLLFKHYFREHKHIKPFMATIFILKANENE